MPRLSRLGFHVMNALADGCEPFSMIYQDIVELGKPEWDTEAVATSVCTLLSHGMLELCRSESAVCGGFMLTPDILTEHYQALDQELESAERPFYYSKGEYFFRMTLAGRDEWNRDEYRPFYPTL
jgi:hypothetical protein